jgi:drug/metabolite transporter (DMT)-like permease
VRSYWPLILTLAAMWGASYLFIKVAVEDIPPAAMTELRVLIAGLLLLGYLLVRMGATKAVGALRAAWVPCAVLGVINAALPMGLVAWGETHIDSSIAGIAQSTVPLFTFILASRFLPHERVGLTRIAGVAIGFVGVALLAGFPSQGGWWALAGTLAVVVSSLSYASGGVYGQLQVRDIAGPVLATGNMLAAAVVLLPLAIAAPPREAPGLEALAGLAGLILIPTFAGQLVLFRVLRLHGSRKLSIVTYLMPVFAVFYGALLLDEPVTAVMIGAFSLIVVGAVLASGQRFFGYRAQETTAGA